MNLYIEKNLPKNVFQFRILKLYIVKKSQKKCLSWPWARKVWLVLTIQSSDYKLFHFALNIMDCVNFTDGDINRGDDNEEAVMAFYCGISNRILCPSM